MQYQCTIYLKNNLDRGFKDISLFEIGPIFSGNILRHPAFKYLNSFKNKINQFPNSKTIEVPNAGHWVHAENLNDFVKETLFFVESHKIANKNIKGIKSE